MPEDDMTFGLRIRRRPKPLVVELWGELDILAAHLLSDRLVQLAQEARRCLILDLREVSFLDCGGLNLLLRVHHQVQTGHAHLTLVLDQPFLLRVLRLAGLAKVFDVTGDLDSALARSVDGMPDEDAREAPV